MFNKLGVLRRQVKSRNRREIEVFGQACLKALKHKDAWKFITAATFTITSQSPSTVDASALIDYVASNVDSGIGH